MEIKKDNLWKLKVLELVEKYFGEGCYVGINLDRPCNGWAITVIDHYLTCQRTILVANEILRDAHNIDRILEKAIYILTQARLPKTIIGSAEL